MKFFKVKENMDMLLTSRNVGKDNPMYGVHRYGEKAPGWKGDKVQLPALHMWVRRYVKPPTSLCEKCHLVPPCDLANVTGLYNRDPQNWQYQCRKCHVNDDKRNLKPWPGKYGFLSCSICGKWFGRLSPTTTVCSKECRYTYLRKYWHDYKQNPLHRARYNEMRRRRKELKTLKSV